MTREIVKTTANATMFADGTILIKKARASYPHLSRPFALPARPTPEDPNPRQPTPAYSMTAILLKGDHAATKAMCDEVIAQLIAGTKITRVAGSNKFIRDGDAGAKDECIGCWTISARDTRNKPTVVGPDRLKLPDDSPLAYAGAWCNLHIKPWVQDNHWGKRVNANLLAVQFTGGGDPIGGGTIRRDALVEDYEMTENPDDEAPF